MDLPLLAFAWRCHQIAANGDGGTGVHGFNVLIPVAPRIDDCLDAGETRPVVEFHKREVFRIPPRANPAFNGDIDRRLARAQQVCDQCALHAAKNTGRLPGTKSVLASRHGVWWPDVRVGFRIEAVVAEIRERLQASLNLLAQLGGPRHQVAGRFR